MILPFLVILVHVVAQTSPPKCYEPKFPSFIRDDRDDAEWYTVLYKSKKLYLGGSSKNAQSGLSGQSRYALVAAFDTDQGAYLWTHELKDTSSSSPKKPERVFAITRDSADDLIVAGSIEDSDNYVFVYYLSSKTGTSLHNMVYIDHGTSSWQIHGSNMLEYSNGAVYLLLDYDGDGNKNAYSTLYILGFNGSGNLYLMQTYQAAGRFTAFYASTWRTEGRVLMGGGVPS